MLIDAHTLSRDAELRADVCVVGAGAAGITLVRELTGTRLDVCVLESGGLAPDPATQALAAGDSVGFPYYELERTRIRVLGGTTIHWGGVCRPLDPIDFEPRNWVPHSGWPLTKASLDPYYARAQPILELGPYDYELGRYQTPTDAPLPLRRSRFETAISQYSPPTRFGQVYRRDLERAPNVRVLLFANLTEIEMAPESGEVAGFRAATLDGNRLTVRARLYVLAAGAVENARLLLVSNRQRPAGIGNDYDLVGRYFMDHLVVPGGVFLPSHRSLVSGLYEHAATRGVGRQGYLVPSPGTQRRERLLNLRTWLDDTSLLDAVSWTSRGVRAADSLQERVRRHALGDDLGEHIWRVIGDLDDVSLYAYLTFLRPEPELPAYLLTSHVEQAPNPASRVTLSERRNALGFPEARLDWRFGEAERHSLRRAMRLLGEEVGRAGIGRVRVIPDDIELAGAPFNKGASGQAGWPPGVRGGWHHMGTTRMGSHRRNSVVDEHCRVHGVPNLYVASSSVFPTSGYTNPTLTIVALALRLADHVTRRLA